MTDTAVPTSAAGNPIGFGRMLRKEDVRFVRGKCLFESKLHKVLVWKFH